MEGDLDELAKKANAIIDSISDEELIALVRKHEKELFGDRKYYHGNIKPSDDTIFVFGSNPQGIHGAGAAKIAVKYFGAAYGTGEGLQGNSYALPTKDLRVKENGGFRSISKENIIKSIKRLYEVATSMPKKDFKIAYRNTYKKSLSGYTGIEMIEMFKEAGPIPENIIFSKEWIDTQLFVK